MRELLGKLGVVIVAALAPIQAVILSVGILVIADMITGVWAAVKRGREIRSAGLRRTVSKLLIYEIAIIAGFVVETHLVSGLIPITKILGGVIGLVELKSVLENANAITGGDIFKLILQRLGSKNDIESFIKNKNDKS